jgi:hypothetical protein
LLDNIKYYIFVSLFCQNKIRSERLKPNNKKYYLVGYLIYI